MCGMCGIVHADSIQTCDKNELIAMRDVITHRGPDDGGIYHSSSQTGLENTGLHVARGSDAR